MFFLCLVHVPQPAVAAADLTILHAARSLPLATAVKHVNVIVVDRRSKEPQKQRKNRRNTMGCEEVREVNGKVKERNEQRERKEEMG